MSIINESLSQLATSFQNLNPVILNIVIALVILFIGFIIARLLSNLVKRLFQQVKLDRFIYQLLKINIRLEAFIVGLISVLVYFLTIIISLNQVGLLSIVISVLTYVVVVVILIAIILGLKDFIPNFFSGFWIRRRFRLCVSKNITLGNVEGTIQNINSVNICIKTKDDDLVYVPYTLFLKEKLIVS